MDNETTVHDAQTTEQKIAERRAQGEELHRLGRTAHRAYLAWDKITTQEEWDKRVAEAQDDLESGEFLLSRLGAQMYVEPDVISALLVLRRGLIATHEVKSPAEFMQVDLALLAYHNALRAQRMLGDLATTIEFEFFSRQAPDIRLKEQFGRYVPNGFYVEDMLDRATEKLQVMLDRSNRMLIRNLRALRELRDGSLVIHADQVNVAQQQLNQVVSK